MRKAMATHDLPRRQWRVNDSLVEVGLQMGTRLTIKEDQSAWRDPDQVPCTAHRTCQALIAIDQQAVRISTTTHPAACLKDLAREPRANHQSPTYQPATNNTNI